MAESLAQRRWISHGGQIHDPQRTGIREGINAWQSRSKQNSIGCGTREAWKTIFRSGSGSSNLHRSQAVQQNVFLHLFSVKVRSRVLDFRPTWYLGAATLSTFFILVGTGILLMFYYHPSVPQAYADMKDLQFAVASGVFLRNLHRWSAHAMVFLVFAHMFKVFYRGAYRPPRQFNWVIGVIAAAPHVAAQLYRLSASLGPAGVLGGNGWFEHRQGRAADGQADQVPDAGRQ